MTFKQEKREINDIYVVVTKYQLLSSIGTIRKKNNENYVILFVGYFKGLEEIVSNLRSNNIYIEWININNKDKNGNKTMLLNMLSKIVFIYEIRKRIRIYQGIKNVFFPFPDSTYLFPILYYSIDGWENINISYIDDGFATSVTTFHNSFNTAYQNNPAFKFLYKNRKVSTDRLFYVFEPNMIISKGEDCIYKSILIPNTFLKCFLTKNIPLEYQKARFIYFDQNFDMNNMEFERTKRIEVLKEIDSLELDDFFIKRHPANKIQHNDYKHPLLDDENMWECEIPEISFSNKILISVWSTGIFTPAILYNKCYTLISLYKICVNPESEMYSLVQSYIECFMRGFANVNVYIPNSIDELKRILVNL